MRNSRKKALGRLELVVIIVSALLGLAVSILVGAAIAYHGLGVIRSLVFILAAGAGFYLGTLALLTKAINDYAH
jgi:hypothetical protein